MFRRDQPLAWTYHWNTVLAASSAGSPPRFPEDLAPYKEYPGAPLLPLPRPALPEVSLADAFRRRRSCRAFEAHPIELSDLAMVLHGGYGVQTEQPELPSGLVARTVPSAGGLYPIELYLLSFRVRALGAGVYHYHPVDHALELVREDAALMSRISPLFLDQPDVAEAAAMLVICGVPARSLWKYGERGYRYLLMEAGHVAHGANLTAAALDLGSLNLGGFFDMDLATLLGLEAEHELPLYAIALGAPAPGSDSPPTTRAPS